MKDNQHTCEYLSCNKTPNTGSIYCFQHEQREKLKPAQTIEAETV